MLLWRTDFVRTSKGPWPLFRSRIRVMSTIAPHLPLNISETVRDRQMLFVRARAPTTAGYLYGNSFAVRIRLNTDPNLTPNPIRTHDRAPSRNRPRSQKKLCARWESNSWPEAYQYYCSPSALPTELSKHKVWSAAKWLYKCHVIYIV